MKERTQVWEMQVQNLGLIIAYLLAYHLLII